MTIIGRITKDAVVHTTKTGKSVINFSLAVNEDYKPKNGERIKQTTYYNCSYWITPKQAKHLRKGTLVELSGRITASAYPDKDGIAKASLNCHVSSIKIHAWPKEVTLVGKATPAPPKGSAGSTFLGITGSGIKLPEPASFDDAGYFAILYVIELNCMATI